MGNLCHRQLDISYGIGIGGAQLTYLLPIAHPEVNGNDDYAIKVNDANDLTSTILNYFDGNAIKGNLTTGIDGVLIGADGGKISSIVIDDIVYQYDAANPLQVFTTLLGGKLSLNFETGEYSYSINLDQNVLNEKESFEISVIDNDGDTASLILEMNIDYYAQLDANANNIITNSANGSDLNILTQYLTHGDAAPEGAEITAVTSGSANNTSLANGIVTIVNANEGDSFNYTLAGSGTSDTANVVIDYQNASRLQGSYDNDIIIAKSSKQPPLGTQINATVKAGNTYDTANQFGFEVTTLAAGLWISQIQINLRGGTDDNAKFDISDSNISLGSDSVGISDSAADIFSTMTSDNHVLTANFSQNDFTSGDAFWFSFDTDSLNNNTGKGLGESGVTYTITLSDGSVLNGVYVVNDVDGSSGTLIFGNTILDGGEGDDVLISGADNDVLIGGEGNDLLIGGLGDDTLIGGLGEDTFVWNQGDTGTDNITDFNVADDKLDLSDLLQGISVEELAQHLDFSFDATTNSTTIAIDVDNDGEAEQYITLDCVDLRDEFGITEGTLDVEGSIIQGLLGSNGEGALIIDTAASSTSASPTQFANASEPSQQHEELTNLHNIP
ncbi:type I secretion C-terminal target domain-containing protein [Shewanella sp. D64]|uniref:calcium-binding protein n=1 Tax=unclassified Shewanella TaxID=196818 RepID=UPI0022BA6F42|nr:MULTISPECIES: calcium-binding protein [unclassified Shewanella]MEC4726167.1 type I secretion C-terminal target domain-containing protein [Shewanella sp. D64]MEC4737917.1 type I secretion C-terminal target domain-containing protein [Shewanella sp. E94]WBJ96119.1 type I secretion C-terminal target domain-containing protein [Shewanella sp. MTB7]